MSDEGYLLIDRLEPHYTDQFPVLLISIEDNLPYRLSKLSPGHIRLLVPVLRDHTFVSLGCLVDDAKDVLLISFATSTNHPSTPKPVDIRRPRIVKF